MLDMKKYPVVEVRLDAIDFSNKEFQCRAGIDEEAVKRLIESIKQFGQQTPIDLIDPQNSSLPAVMRGAHRCEAVKRNGGQTVLARVIPISDLGPEPKKTAANLSLLDNVEQNSLNDRDIVNAAGILYGYGDNISVIARKLKANRHMVHHCILIHKAGPEVSEAAKHGLLPIKKTGEFLFKGCQNQDEPKGCGSGSHPTPDGADNLQINVENTNKLVEALKSPNPKESAKAVLEGVAPVGEAQAPTQESSGPSFSFKKSGNGLKATLDFPGSLPTLADFTKAAKELYLKFQASQKQPKPSSAAGKPDLKAQKAAEQAKKDLKVKTDRLKETIKGLEESAKKVKKSGGDPAAILQQAINLKAQLKGLKPPPAIASKGTPATIASRPEAKPAGDSSASPDAPTPVALPADKAGEAGADKNEIASLTDYLNKFQQMIRDIESGQVPAMVLPTMLKQFETMKAATEQQLGAPGNSDEKTTLLKKMLEAECAGLEMIKKKLGQQPQ